MLIPERERERGKKGSFFPHRGLQTRTSLWAMIGGHNWPIIPRRERMIGPEELPLRTNRTLRNEPITWRIQNPPINGRNKDIKGTDNLREWLSLRDTVSQRGKSLYGTIHILLLWLFVKGSALARPFCCSSNHFVSINDWPFFLLTLDLQPHL